MVLCSGVFRSTESLRIQKSEIANVLRLQFCKTSDAEFQKVPPRPKQAGGACVPTGGRRRRQGMVTRHLSLAKKTLMAPVSLRSLDLPVWSSLQVHD